MMYVLLVNKSAISFELKLHREAPSSRSVADSHVVPRKPIMTAKRNFSPHYFKSRHKVLKAGFPTERFTTLKLLNPSHGVSELQKIR